MATQEISNGGKASGRRTKKTAPRVDLTAMVDLMFLLTTFLCSQHLCQNCKRQM
ncbi:hypothetical protein QWY86_07435 [Pedobacter aquatilis]|uniref:hypothetical protein n=1 Tax=Pedobacter aquatilis TaxID=351343 RepID=UPI0025B4D012|nr:hypothetical protein [Pedobacter aquatilis]MDN3586490.1 hypothetical protein [Pedobacter aquatilis]